MLINLRAVKGCTGLTNQTVKILSLSMTSCSPDCCRLLSRGRARKKYDVEKGKSYENKIDQFRSLGNCSPTPPLSQHWVGGQLPPNLNSSYINPVDTLEILQFDRCSNAENSAMTRLSKLTVPSHLNISLFLEISVLQIFLKGQVHLIFFIQDNNEFKRGMSYCSYNKHLLDSTFVISELNQVKVSVTSPAQGRG